MSIALRELSDAVSGRVMRLQLDLQDTTTERNILRDEVATVSLQRDMMSADLTALSAEHEALRGAYNSLEGESQQASLKLASRKNDDVLLRETEAKLATVLADLNEANLRLMDMNQIDASNRDLELRLTKSEISRITAESQVREAQCEAQSYKNLNEALKAKIREYFNKDNDSSNRQFMDTFEEVCFYVFKPYECFCECNIYGFEYGNYELMLF